MLKVSIFLRVCILKSYNSIYYIRVILITQNRDIKTRDVAHCVSSLLRKLAMLASDDKIAMLREELRMPRLLVQPFPACYSVRAKWDRRDVNNDR